MKNIKDFLKNNSQLVIWAIGFFVLWLIWPGYEHEPKFIRENELITWNMAEKMVYVVLGILGIQRLTGNYLFRDEDQDKWSKEIDKRIATIESSLLNESSIGEFKNRIISELERNLLKFDQKMKKDFQVLQDIHLKLEKRVYDHLQEGEL